MTVVKHLRGSREVRISVDLGDCESSIARLAPQNLSCSLEITQAGRTQPTKVAGKLRRAVRSSRFAGILGGRHMECAYYFDFCRLCQADKQQIRVSP